MPIAVILQNIDGTRRLKSVIDPHGGLNKCLPIGDESFPLLQYVDLYGDAVFNPRQMPQVIRELELLINRCSEEESKVLLEKVRELALECQDARICFFVSLGTERMANLLTRRIPVRRLLAKPAECILTGG